MSKKDATDATNIINNLLCQLVVEVIKNRRGKAAGITWFIIASYGNRM
jgi:hypothetical protein